MRTLLKFILSSMTVMAISRGYGQTDSTKLEDLNLKQLLNIKITTASRTAQAIDLASAAVIVVTKEKIRNRGYRSLLDVLFDLPDIKVDDKIYSGIRNSVTIRGIQGAQNFVLLLNGAVISSPSGEAMLIMENYPVHLAEQIEILYGPASALYGANAVSGVINIITKNAGNKDLQVEVSSIAGMYGYTNTTLFLTKKLNDEVTITASGQYFYDKGPDYSKLYKGDSLYDMTSHRTGVFNTIYGPMQPATPVKPEYEMPMQAYNIYAGVQAGHFSFNFFRNYFKLPNGFENNPNNTVYNRDVFIAQAITMANASYKRQFNKFTTTTNMVMSEYNLDPTSNYRNLYTQMERAYKFATSSMMKLEEQLDYKAGNKLQLSAGVGYEGFHSIPQSADLDAPVDKNSYVGGIIAGTRTINKPEGLPAQFYVIKFHNIGTYLQAQYAASEKMYMTIGARYDINSRYGSSFNPRMGIVYKPANTTTIKLLYGSAFLAPSPSAAYVQYGSFDTHDSGKTWHSHFLHLPNPGLKPVRSYNTELNISQQVTDDIIVTADAYYTVLTGLFDNADDNANTQLYNNMFNGVPVDYIEVFVNRKRQKNYGGSLRLNWRHYFGPVRMNAYASYSYVNGIMQDGSGKDMETDFIAHSMGRVGADVKIGTFTVSPRLLMMGRQHLPGIAETDGSMITRQNIPGYELLNISLRYQASKYFAVFANITNALNQDYRNVSFNMDLNNKNTELFYGQHQDPIRIMGGIQFDL